MRGWGWSKVLNVFFPLLPTQAPSQTTHFENVSYDWWAAAPKLQTLEICHSVNSSSMSKLWPPEVFQPAAGKSEVATQKRGCIRKLLWQTFSFHLLSIYATRFPNRSFSKFWKYVLCTYGYCNTCTYKLENLSARHVSLANLCLNIPESMDHTYHV